MDAEMAAFPPLLQFLLMLAAGWLQRQRAWTAGCPYLRRAPFVCRMMTPRLALDIAPRADQRANAFLEQITFGTVVLMGD